MYKFKHRNGLHKVNFPDKANIFPLATLSEECYNWRGFYQLYWHNREDTYNKDEAGLFFWMEPNQTLNTGKISGRKKLSYFVFLKKRNNLSRHLFF